MSLAVDPMTAPRLPPPAFLGPLTAVAAFSAVVNLLMLTVPLYLMQVYDRVLSSRSLETLAVLTVAALGALAVYAALDAVRSRVLLRLGVRLEDELSRAMLQAGVADAAAGGARSAQGLRDVAELRGLLTGPAVLAPFDAPWVPVFVGIIFLLHPALGAVAIGGAAALSFLVLLSDVATRRPQGDASAAAAAALDRVEGLLRNAEAIEAMGMLPAVTRRWHRATVAALRPLAVANSRAGLIAAAAKFTRLALQVAALATGAALAVRGEITPGAMVAASILMGRALAPVEAAAGAWRALVSAQGARRRLVAALARARPHGGAMPLPRPEGRLAVERVALAPAQGGRPILGGVSFALEPGESLGIIGPSGAGKSTLARLLVGGRQPDRGCVRLDGADVAAWDPDDRGRHVGYLPQDVQLIAGTVRDNIARLDPDADPEAVVRAARAAGVHEMILRLPNGYETEVGDGGAMLSGGQRQRIGLARTLYGDPRLLVLDEPNAHLDQPGEQALLAAIAAAKATGATVVVVGHRPSLLAQVDKLLVLRDGAVELFGPRREVLPRVTRPAIQPAGAGAPHLAAVPAPAASGQA